MGNKKVYELEGRVVDVHRRAGSVVRPVGVVSIPQGPTSFRVGSEEWLLVSAEEDPNLRDGSFVVPDPVLERLAYLERTKVSFDGFFIAHELVPGTLGRTDNSEKGGASVAAMVPKGSADARTVKVLDSCNRVLELPGRAARKVLGTSGKVLGALADALPLDPALFGVVTASGTVQPGELAAWFLIAAWT